MDFEVLLLENAIKDLEMIYQSLKQRASKEVALREMERLEAACASLTENPGCGSVPHELERINTVEYRQVYPNRFGSFTRSLKTMFLSSAFSTGKETSRIFSVNGSH